MDNNFDKCLAFVLKEEGGNDDDPHDHGGRTSRGITQREWDKFRLTHPDRPSDVWKASDDDIKTIYHTEYWLPHCSGLPSGLDLVYFDFGVNAGVGQATKTLQKSFGITPDGIWGQETDAAVKALVSNQNITYTSGNSPLMHTINAFCNFREDFYKGLAQFSRYGKGWTSRNEACRKEAFAMINVSVPSPQANPVDVKTKITPTAATIAVGTAGATVAAQHMHSPLIFLGIIAAVLVVGGLIHYFVNRKAN